MTTQRKVRKSFPEGKFAPLTLSVLDTPAWRALSSSAQALYPWLILEFKGSRFNNNGRIRLSVRQAAWKMGTSKDTAARAFIDLQLKGFIKVRKGASLGVFGMGKSPEYEIAAIPMPENGNKPNNYFRNWAPGNDFSVFKHPVKNGNGKNNGLS